MRESATAGELRKYSGFAPDEGNADGDTSSVGAVGAPPGPPGFVIVAVLSIGVIGGVPAAMRTSKTTVAVPFAATAMFVTLTWPVPFAPVPAPVDALVAPAGKLTTASEPSSAARSSTTLTPVAATPADSTSVIV